MHTSAIETLSADASEPLGADSATAKRDVAALRFIDLAAESLIVAALLGELALVLANVAARIYFQRSFLWTDEIARLALSILAFIGGAVAYRRRDHAFVRVILSRLPSRGERKNRNLRAAKCQTHPAAGHQR